MIHTSVIQWVSAEPTKFLIRLSAVHPGLTQGAGPLGSPSPASYFTVSWYKLPGLLEYSGGWLCWPPGRNPSVTMNALALKDELVEVDHLLGASAEEPGSGGGGSEPPETTESVSGSDIPERMESASLLLATVVTSHEEQRLTWVDDTDRDRELEPVLLFWFVSSWRDTCTHCDCP